jgi:hypothetical protein
MARRDIAAVALVTDEFWAQGEFIAASFGMPDIPRVQLPHPLAGTGTDSHRLVAEKIAAELVAALEGS